MGRTSLTELERTPSPTPPPPVKDKEWAPGDFFVSAITESPCPLDVPAVLTLITLAGFELSSDHNHGPIVETRSGAAVIVKGRGNILAAAPRAREG
jgi:hypothetical protein